MDPALILTYCLLKNIVLNLYCKYKQTHLIFTVIHPNHLLRDLRDTGSCAIFQVCSLWIERVLRDEISVLQGKLEGCTVNSHGVIRNHTTYYLILDAHVHTDPLDLLEPKITSSAHSGERRF